FPTGRRYLVFAASNDKDIPGMFRVLAPHFEHAFLTSYRNSSRSVPPAELAEQLGRVADLPCSTYASAAEAWQAAHARRGPDDLISISGSVFLAGEMRSALLEA